MFEFLEKIYSALSSTTRQFSADAVAAQIGQFRTLINTDAPKYKTIRLLVEAGASFGHQASTANLMYRLARTADQKNLTFGYTGTIELYYERDDELDKLKALIPETAGQEPYKIDGATIKLIKYAGKPAGAAVFLGLTGGANVVPEGGFQDYLNVENFLRLQPYNWGGDEQIFIGADPVVDLLTVKEVGAANFKRRLYTLPSTSYDNVPWNLYQQGAFPAEPKARAAIVEHLTSQAFLDEYALQTVYSVKSLISRLNTSPTFGAALVCASVLEWQKKAGKPYAKAKPTVILNFDDFGTTQASQGGELKKVLNGGLANDEAGFQLNVEHGDRDAVANYDRRKSYFEALDAGTRFHFLNYPEDLEDVQSALTVIEGKKDNVLFIQLGRSFPAVFDHAMFKSTLPPVFEGQNTANLCVNIGQAFMQVPAPNLGSQGRLAIYPSVTLAEYNSQAVPAALLNTATQISHAPYLWPVSRAEAPSLIVGQVYQEYTDERADTGTIHRYFANLKTFFASPEQDKLALAVAYMNALLQPGDNQVVANAAPENPLDALYDKIDAAVKAGGVIDLAPGILAGGSIPDFITSFLKDFAPTLTLTKATTFEPATKPATLDKITLAGPTTAFHAIDVDCDVTITFTAPKGVLAADIRFDTKADWAMPGAPWMAFKAPFVVLTLSDGKKLIAAEMGGIYPALEQEKPPISAELDIRIGGAEDYWPASIRFTETYPSIASAYQLLTGYNVINSLPAPFNVLADLGVSDIEIDYDQKAKNVNSLTVVAQNNTEDLPLFGELSLKNTKITATITQPTTLRKLSLGASAEFNIGKTEPAVVSVAISYPGIVFQGALASGTLTISKIVETFVPGTNLMLPHEPVIDGFNFLYDKPNDNLAVSMHMTMQGWDFTFPFTSEPLFSLNSVGFQISRQKGANTGNITANTTLLPKAKDPKNRIGVEVGAYYLADKSWKFEAKTTPETVVDIDALIGEYLGASWVPTDIVSFPKLKDLSVAMTWGEDSGSGAAKTFEFKARTAEAWKPIPALGDLLSATFDLTIGYDPSKGKDEATVTAMAAIAGPGPGRATMLPSTAAASPVPATETDGMYGKLLAAVTLWNIHLSVEYDFAPGVQKVIVVWTDVGLKAVVETAPKDDKAKGITKGDTIATFSLDGESVGSMVEKFVGWATGTEFGLMAPWNILDEIKLSGLSVVYNFTTKKVSFNIGIGPIDLGLFTLKGITLAYNPDGNPSGEGDGNSSSKVAINIEGSFIWQSGDAISWAPDNPQSTPAPPGGGNKYFDLRLLALGQHVSVPGLVNAPSVVKVIEELESLEIPAPPDIPLGGPGQPTFDPQSSWFVGFDFGVLKTKKDDGNEGASAAAAPANGAVIPARSTALAKKGEAPDEYFITLSVVFNDPNLYALRIALAGPMAKIFKGLDFQIMYQQVSKNVGKYSAQIVLPDIMRKFQIGVASITLPTFAIEIYTNGDFQVDIGFPWNQDFSRSFSIEVQVGYFPVLGSAGFYFGKLSSATTTKVPTTSMGWFNPVIVFGFGAQVGLGKSIEAGILSAGFSITVFGIIEGVIARYLPYHSATAEGKSNELQDGYFFSLSGTVGVQGRLYGSINFAIISAELNIRISISVKITFASYEPIPITVQALVDVSLAVKINLGLFKITIHLSFKMQVKATFKLDNPMKGPAPWADNVVAANAAAPLAWSGHDLLRARGLRKLDAAEASPLAMAASAPGFVPDWGHLQAGTTLQMTGYMVPVLTVVGDTATSYDTQDIAYVVNFFLRDVKPVQTGSDAPTAASAADTAAEIVAPEAVARVAHQRARAVSAMDAAGNSFQDLAVRVLQWVLAAGMGEDVTPDTLDAKTVSDSYLSDILGFFSDDTNPAPIPSGKISAFLDLQSQFTFSLQQEADPDGSVPAVFFPAAPDLHLDMPAFAGSPHYAYDFGKVNASTAGYLGKLNAYFNQLKVQVEAEPDPANANAAPGAPPVADGPSITDYIFADYFTMIARQTVQAMRDGLANFLLPLSDFKGQGASAIVAHISQWDGYSLAELFAANTKHPLNTGASAGLTIAGMHWSAAGGQSFADLAALPVFGAAFDATALALANADDARIIAAGQKITVGGNTHLTQTGDSLTRIAKALELADAAALLSADPELLKNADLLAPQSILDVPDFQHKIVAGDTLETVAQQYAMDVTALASAANGSITDLFEADGDEPNLNVPHLVQYQIGALIDEMRRSLALQHVSAMMSRYYLHGLRMPTTLGPKQAPEKLVPATGVPYDQSGAYPDDLGLFALTGQTLPLPTIPDPATQKEGDPFYSFTVSGPSGGWLKLGSTGSLTYQLDATLNNTRYQQYSAVRSAAHAGYLDMQSSAIAPLAAAEMKPARFPLSREIVWQSASTIDLPTQPAAPTTPRPRLWSLPNPLINLPKSGAIRPTLQPVIARSDEAKGTTVDDPVANFGFGSLISFKVKKIVTADGAGAVKRTYEIIGAPESEIVLLERLLDQLQNAPDGFQQVALFYRPAATGSEAAGWQSDDPSQSLMGITQTNLSTETHPPEGLTASAAPTEFGNLIGSPNEFARLLWEASITRQGGFFLTYSTGDPKKPKGLPDHVFNDRGEAEVAFFALYKLAGDKGLTLGNFMNVVATNEGFDLSGAALIAKAVEVPLDQGRSFQTGTDTLASYAADYYMGVGVLAELNSTATLADKATVTVHGGLYQVPAVPPAQPDKDNPGGDLGLIAQHFGVKVTEIQDANIAGTALPATLAPMTAIKLPGLDVTIGGDAPGTTLAELSAYYGAPLATLAAANAEKSLFASAPLKVVVGPVSLAPQIKEGTAGITLERPEPKVPDTVDGNWGLEYLRQTFSLLGYRIADNTGNAWFAESNWGLPAGPVEPDPGTDGHKLQAPASGSSDGKWHFNLGVPYTSVLAAGDKSASPYLGVGSLMTLDLAWLDVFGNRIQSEFRNPTPPAGGAQNKPPQITGYTDRLFGVGQWPSVANTYKIAETGGAPTLSVILRFDGSVYIEAANQLASPDPDTVDGAKRKLAQAIHAYTLIIAQLGDPAGVTVGVASTLVPQAGWTIDSFDQGGKPAGLYAWTKAILAWLQGLSASSTDPFGTPDYSQGFDLSGKTLNADQIFKLRATLTLSRVAALVNGDLATAPGVASSATPLTPWTGDVKNDDVAQQRGLAEFATAFAAAFADAGGHAFRIATGSDRDVFTGASDKPLWVVQLGKTAGTDAISFTVANAGDPTVYAPRPISNVLKSKAQTQILPYKTGTPIDPKGTPQLSAFTSIDLDKWMRSTLSSIDALLTPKYVTPADILRHNILSVGESPFPDALQQVLDAKEALAKALKGLMIPVYEGEDPGDTQKAEIQEAFRQGMLGMLGQFYTVKAGLQFAADVNSAIVPQPSAEQPPRIYGDVAQSTKPAAQETGPGTTTPPAGKNITISSPSVRLHTAGAPAAPAYLSSLVSSTSTDAKCVSLSLTYEGQNIEHEIGSLPGIDGYTPSSWLSFVDLIPPKPPAGQTKPKPPFQADLGSFDVPIVLRAFPDMPSLVRQDLESDLSSPCYQPPAAAAPKGKPPAKPFASGDYNPLAEATRWAYSFTYSMQVHEQQDGVHGTIAFNIQDPDALMANAAPPRDLFDNLAQFVQVYPKVLDDLNTYLVPIDVGTTDATTLKNAQAALISTATMISMLAETAAPLGSGGGTGGHDAAPLGDSDITPVSGSAPAVEFLIEEGAVEISTGKGAGDSVSALLVTVKTPDPLPARVGAPFVEIDGYTCQRHDAGITPPKGWQAASFVYLKDGDYLPASIGRTIAARSFVLPDLGIIERQDAQTSVYLTRNSDIVPGKTIAKPFVYRTPEISFQGPLHPTLVNDTPINIATVFSTGPTKPVTRSLAEQLAAFYTALFEHAGTPDVTMQMGLYYAYSQNPAIDAVRLPVYLMPPTQITLPAGGVFSAGTAPIPQQVAAWDAWFSANTPDTTRGQLQIDLTVMSDLTAQPMPILKLTGAFIDYANLG